MNSITTNEVGESLIRVYETISMNKNFIFYRCYLERGAAAKDEPGLFAATEVVQAVCAAGFQRDGLSMKCYPSSPHCYYKFAKTPKSGMFMLRVVKKKDMTTLDILIDTRLYPNFVMIEKQNDWEEVAEEVIGTLEWVINYDADKLNWHVKLREYRSNTTQNLDDFLSALNYIDGKDEASENQGNNIQIGQLVLKVNGNNYYNGDTNKNEPMDASETAQPANQDILQKLMPLFYNNEDDVKEFLKEIEGMPPNNITDLVNQWVQDKRISNYGYSRKGDLWKILNGAGLYTRSSQNWNRRVF